MNPFQTGKELDPPQRVGNYRIEERLGSGGMGVVYRAFDEALQRPLAIKQLLPGKVDSAASQRFRREAMAAARLNHPAIVHIYEIVETDKGDWIVMELVEGQRLDRLLRAGSLELPQALRLSREIAEGLAEAHGQGILHRDLKATNVMVTASGRAKILDFGLAKFLDLPDTHLSRTGVLIGTYHAMSPEQALGLDLDLRSDLFSLGSLLYEVFTGISPFRSSSAAETLARICSLRPTPVQQLRAEIPGDVADLIDLLLRKDPNHRPQSAREVAAILEDAEASNRLAKRAEAPSGVEASSVERVEPVTESTLIDGWAAVACRRPLSERRQLTVVCCEVVDAGKPASPISTALDPENLYEVMADLRSTAREVARRFNGRLGTGLSHRLLIYFGYPQAHEEEAARAIGAAVELVALASRMTALADGGRAVRPALRAGVHTGAVIVATDPEQVEPLTLGSTLDLATGLQILAPPGGVVVSAATHSLIRKSFKMEPLPPARIAGFDEPVAAFRVLESAGPLDESMEALPPLVGREREIEMLLSRWILASEGLGQVVLLSGESGMGKSRLTQALRERIGDDAARWLFCYGSPDALISPLWPVAGLLRRTVDLQPEDSPRERLASLLRDLSLEEAEPFLAPLLGFPDEERPASGLSPERQKEKTLEALASLILEMAERQPVVLRIEDLQWLDPTSVRWLDLLIAQVTAVPLFLLVTLRPQSVEKLWGPSAHLTQLALGPLSDEETDLLIQRVAGERALPDAVRRQIAARADGVPLFIEELTRAVLEGERPELPATLLDSLTARLDRLGTAKEVAQIASVIGRSFNSELLASVSSRDEVEVQRELKRLVQAELVHRKGFGANARYYFKNQLVRDAAYESLLKKERQQFHRRIAEALEERFPESADAQPEILAHHFGEGGVLDRAIDFWHRAGRQALGRSANLEAIHHFEKGRSLLAGLPPGTARDEAELLLQKGFVPAVIATQGFTSPEVERAYRRALELCDYRGAADLELLWGLCSYHTMRGELGSALPLGERMLKLAESRSCAPSLCQSHYSLGGVRFLLGDLAAAGEHFRAACATDEPDIGRALMFTFGADDRKAAAAYESLVLWLQGHPNQAMERQRQALAWARRESSPVTLSRVLLLSCFFHLFRRDGEAARTCAEEMLAINEDLGLFQAADARVMLGCAQAAGDPAGQDEGIASLRRSLDVYRASGFKVFLTFYLSELAAACLRRDRLEEAEAALGEAFQALTDSGERFWSAELHRLAASLDRRRLPAESR